MHDRPEEVPPLALLRSSRRTHVPQQQAASIERILSIPDGYRSSGQGMLVLRNRGCHLSEKEPLREAAKHLRLAPSMHRDVVPPDEQFPAAEGAGRQHPIL